MSYVVFDLDGVIANMDHVLPYVATNGKKKRFDLWEQGYETADINDGIKAIIDAFVEANIKVYVVTGRSRDHRDATIEWLERNDIRYHRLLMRERGSKISNAEFKKKQLEHVVQANGGKMPLMVFEDNPKTIAELRRMRYNVADVGRHNRPKTRKFLTKADLKAGDRLLYVGPGSCMKRGHTYDVYIDSEGPYVVCEYGQHYVCGDCDDYFLWEFERVK